MKNLLKIAIIVLLINNANAYEYKEVYTSITCPILNETQRAQVICPPSFTLVIDTPYYYGCENYETKQICVYPKDLKKVEVDKKLIDIMKKLDTNNEESLSEYFVKLATFDVDTYKKLEEKDSEATFFIGTAFKFQEAFYKLSFVLFLIFLVLSQVSLIYNYIIASLDVKEQDFVRQKLLEVKEFAIYKSIPFLSFFVFALVPIKKGEIHSEPLLISFLRDIYVKSVKVADEVSYKLTENVIKEKIAKKEKVLKERLKRIRKKIEIEKERIKELENTLKVCQKQYNTSTFLLSPNYYNLLSCQEEYSKCYTKGYCRYIETTYLNEINKYNALVKNYNIYVSFLNDKIKSNLNEIVKNYQKYINDVSLKGEIARLVYAERKLGFLAFPLFTSVSLGVDFANDESMKVDIEIEEKGIVSETFKLIAKTLFYISVPPGNMIYEAIDRFKNKLFDVDVSSLFKNIFNPLALASGLIAKAVSEALSPTMSVLIALLSYKIVKTLFMLLPAFAIALVTIFKFLSYLLNVFKSLISSMLLVVFAPSKEKFKRHFETFMYNVFYLSLYPTLLLASSFVSLFALFVGYHLGSYINVFIPLSISTSLAKLIFSSNIVAILLKYPIVAAVDYLYYLFLAYFIFKLTLSTPEKIANMLGISAFAGREEAEAERISESVLKGGFKV